jgi:uncharacterized protein with HEPN domain
MQREPKAYLWDAHNAVDAIFRFTRDKDYAAFRADELVRAAVEREFEIIGEPLRQLVQVAPEMAAKIPHFRRIIAFRNILVHGYATIDHANVWRVIQRELAPLRETLASLLNA